MEQWSCSVNPEGVCARDQRVTLESGGKEASKIHSYVYTCILIKSHICLFPVLVGICTPHSHPLAFYFPLVANLAQDISSKIPTRPHH